MTKDTIVGGGSLLLGIAYLIGASIIPEVQAGDEIGPRLFPYLIGSAAALFGGALLVADRRKPERPPFSFGFLTERAIWLKIATIIALAVLYGQTLDSLGYVVGTILFMLLVGSVINRGRTVQNAVMAVCFSCVCYAVFSIALKLSLPRGLLSFLPF